MPHVDITMIPGRDDATKKEIAIKVQQFLAKELTLDEKFVSVSIKDIAKEDWAAHMDTFERETLFVLPGV